MSTIVTSMRWAAVSVAFYRRVYGMRLCVFTVGETLRVVFWY